MDFSQIAPGTRSGMLMIGGQYAAMCVERAKEEINLVYIESEGEGNKRTETLVESLPCIANGKIYFKIQFNNDQTCVFCFSTDGINWSKPTRKFSAKGAHWVGAKIGIFSIVDGNNEKEGYADFSYFKVTATDK